MDPKFVVVAGLGAPAYDLASCGNEPLDFPLWGAMGGAAMVGLGLALAQPARRVLVLTGDGELLMGLGSLATIAVHRPGNLALVVFDNERYGETGMQATHTAHGVDLAAVAQACGFPTTGTLREYARYRDLALTASRMQLEALPMSERLQVLIIRARVPSTALRTMDGRDVFAYAVDRGWIGREGVERSELGTLQVDGDTAAARLKIGRTELPVDFEFEREATGWRFNLIPLTLMSEDVFRQLARQKGVGENEMVMTLLRDLMETPVDDRIWDAPAP